jgi:hypothetical protein
LKSKSSLETLELEFKNYYGDSEVPQNLKKLLDENQSIQTLLIIDLPCATFPRFKLTELSFSFTLDFDLNSEKYSEEFFECLSKVQVEKLNLSSIIHYKEDSLSFLAKDVFIKEFCINKQRKNIKNLFTWIGSFIEQNETMEKLSLIGFDVISDDLLNFTNSLRKNKKIHYLDISGTTEYKDEHHLEVLCDSMEIFVESMNQNKNISTLDLTNCVQYLNVGCLENLLKENKSITKLNLSSLILCFNGRK